MTSTLPEYYRTKKLSHVLAEIVRDYIIGDRAYWKSMFAKVVNSINMVDGAVLIIDYHIFWFGVDLGTKQEFLECIGAHYSNTRDPVAFLASQWEDGYPPSTKMGRPACHECKECIMNPQIHNVKVTYYPYIDFDKINLICNIEKTYDSDGNEIDNNTPYIGVAFLEMICDKHVDDDSDINVENCEYDSWGDDLKTMGEIMDNPMNLVLEPWIHARIKDILSGYYSHFSYIL